MNFDERKARWAAEEQMLGELLEKHRLELELGPPSSAIPLGWRAIVDELFADLAALGCRKIVQIKSKFFELRVYLPDGATAEELARVEQAVERSCRTCERCGAPADRLEMQRGATLCSACAPASAASRS